MGSSDGKSDAKMDARENPRVQEKEVMADGKNRMTEVQIHKNQQKIVEGRKKIIPCKNTEHVRQGISDER